MIYIIDSVYWELGMGHGAWGMGHGAWGMGHGAWGMRKSGLQLNRADAGTTVYYK
jgi:hypothetical protein